MAIEELREQEETHAREALSSWLLHGVRADALLMAQLRVAGLGRGLMRRLVAAGLSDRLLLKAAGKEAVRKVLNHRGAFAALWDKLAENEEPEPSNQYLQTEMGAALLRRPGFVEISIT